MPTSAPPQLDAAIGHLEIDGRSVPITLKRNPRARRFVLRIDPSTGGVRVTVPERSTPAQAMAFARRQTGWIAARLGRLPQSVPFEDGALVPYLGEMHAIRHAPGVRGRGAVWREDGGNQSETVEDALPAQILVGGDPAFLARRVRDWLRAEAKRHLSDRVAVHAARLGAQPARIVVRDQTSRWGSCSSTRTLSFSWRLVLAPADVLDYVAAHETAHLLEMNHSPRFWRHVEAVMPDYRRPQSWPERHGAGLHRYGSMERSPPGGALSDEAEY